MRSRTTRTSSPIHRRHPEPTNAFLQTAQIHDLMVSFGDGAKKIWGTEVGAPTAARLGERDEPGHLAARVLRHLERLGVHRPAALVHRATPGNANDLEDSYGLVHHDRTPKPGLAAFRAMVASSALEPATTIPRS